MNEDAGRARELRNAMVDQLVADGTIKSSAVEAAFRVVPREQFTPPGTPLDVVYGADKSVVTKTDQDGVAMSSVSAPVIQALMIKQAEIGPGMTVLEIGSGGYNAALLAEVTGPAGRVISLDIDPDVVNRASTVLKAGGYGDRVRVVLGDAENGVPGHAPFDRIIVTAGAWDIPLTWVDQLAGEGRIVLPLRMNGITRVIAFRPDRDHLVSTSAEVAGFVPMQGDGAHAERVFLLPTSEESGVRLRFDQQLPGDLGLLDAVMVAGPEVSWSGVTIGNQVSFADLHLWFAGYLPGFCKVGVDAGVDLVPDGIKWFPFGMVQAGSFACLVTRPALDRSGSEFGSVAYGPGRAQAARTMNAQIRAWNQEARHGPGPTFEVWPFGTDLGQLPKNAILIAKTHSLVVVIWPLASVTAITG